MRIKEGHASDALRRVTCRLTAQVHLGEDLVQEARVHLSFLEGRRFGLTRGWYLQKCRFEFRDSKFWASSIRSCTMRHAEVRSFTAGNCELWGAGGARLSRFACDDPSAREILESLSSHVSEFETEILACLILGMDEREIASRIGLMLGASTTSAFRGRPDTQATRLFLNRGY